MQNKFFSLFKRKSASSSETVTLNQLLEFLGIAGTDSSELSEATYYACIKVLAESVGKLPLLLQQSTEAHGVEQLRGHMYYRMLKERPNKYMSASVFWAGMEMHRNHYGNAYALIDTRNPKQPQLWPLDPERMRVVYDDGLLFNTEEAKVYYYYTTKDGFRVYTSEELLHFKSHHTVDGLVGIPVREQLTATIQGNAKAQKLVNKMYDSGMTAKAVLQYTSNIKEASVEAMTKGIQKYLNGEMHDKGIDNLIPLPLGLSLTPLNMKLSDSQFLEVKQYSALQIASAFGVRPYQIGDYTKTSYSSAEAQQLSFLVDTLLFNLKGYEEEISYKLLSDEEEAQGIGTKFDTSVLLRTDRRNLIETLSTAVNSFLMTPNEARHDLNLPSKPGGDELLGNGASIPVQYTGSQYTNTAREEEKKWLREIITETLREFQQ